MTKTQTAVARIQTPATGEWAYDVAVVVTIDKTQSATATIVLPTTGEWAYDIDLSGMAMTQPAVARISVDSIKTQIATATISTWVLINTSGTNIVSYEDTSILPNVTYRYRVASISAGVIGEYIYSNNVVLTVTTFTKTQTATAKIAGMAIHSMMMGVNF